MLQKHPLGVFLQGADQLKGHSGPAKIRKGIGAAASVGIHYGRRLREGFPRAVVVCDHHIDAKTSGVSDLLQGGDAVVHCDDKGHSSLLHLVDGGLVEAVALLLPGWDVVKDIRPGIFQVVV